MSAVPPGGIPPPVYSPVTRPVVGNESAEQKVQALPPVEQPDQAEQLRDRRRHGSGAHHREEDEASAVAEEGDPATDPALPVPTPAPAFRILPTGTSAGGGARVRDAFDQAPSDPGQLLDGRV
jgi:hypothetical protein